MLRYKLSNQAKEDLIRIHQFGVKTFGERQADIYFKRFFEYFEIIAKRPLSFESVDHIKLGYRKCVCGVDTIYYRIVKDSVQIMTIIGRQDLKKI